MDNDGYYDSIADGYDELYTEEQKKKLKIIKENITIKPDSKILDIGCGSGESSNFECKVVGIDPSARLVEIAKQKFRDSDDHEFFVAKGEQIPEIGFKNKEFDYVISVSALHHVAEDKLDDLLIEINRIGKRYVFSLLKRSIKRQKIINAIKKKFSITEEKEEDKDIILFCDEKRFLEEHN
ncbi:class I SAM-dependent methyltransferase [Candidatus Woesearchaeota archaeon]|nr:class I SAM-dependent methyltransferase [Candidatus Woesearchaeota archaeon]